MPNTSTIAFALIVGYIVFITVRGELPVYLGVIGFGPDKNNTCANTTQTGGSSGGSNTSTPVTVSNPGTINILQNSGSTFPGSNTTVNPPPNSGGTTSSTTITYEGVEGECDSGILDVNGNCITSGSSGPVSGVGAINEPINSNACADDPYCFG